MPRFCRHNRFIERCPICSRELEDAGRTATGTRSRSRPRTSTAPPRARRGDEGVTVRREQRPPDDGFRSELVPGLRSRADVARLAGELAFSHARLIGLAEDPPGLYADVRALATRDAPRATWLCFLIAYLSPLEAEDPFAGIRLALERSHDSGDESSSAAQQPVPSLPDLEGVPLGPRSSHDPSRGGATMLGFRQRLYAAEVGSFAGDAQWSAERRFARLFERLALPGFSRESRYELLVALGRLGVYELEPASMQLTPARTGAAEDHATLAAKRVFGIADPLLIDRRASVLAAELAVPLAALDLALANWGEGTRATLGFPGAHEDEGTLARATAALGL